MAHKRPRGKCPACGRTKALRKDGTLHKHQGNGTGRTCAGSGQRSR